MKKTTESIAPEVVIRMLAAGIVAGIIVIVIYSAQALFIHSTAGTSPQATETPAILPAAATAPATSSVAQTVQTTASDKASPNAARPGSKPGEAMPRAEQAPVVDKDTAKTAAGASEPPSHFGKALAVLGTGLLLAGSALLSGTFIGFLFGIPRSLQQQNAPETGSPENNAAAAQNAASGRTAYGANTSLEQISDWLTKILVGVGLTQLSSLPSMLKQFAGFATPGLGGFETSGVFAVALLIYFMTCGFLMSYLWTRLRLGKAFSEADALAAIRGEIETAVASELQKKAQGQMTTDYEALRLTEKQLESGDVPQEKLDKAFHGTSDLYRTHIYQLARTARSENWRDPKKKVKMEHTIPIFRALIATDDKQECYHQNYAQLGFALAEKSTPDYQGAIAALSKAIELRGPAETQGYVWDEFARAKCLADPNSTDPETKERIAKDLHTAVTVEPGLAGIIEQEERLGAWMKANHVSLKSLLASAS